MNPPALKIVHWDSRLATISDKELCIGLKDQEYRMLLQSELPRIQVGAYSFKQIHDEVRRPMGSVACQSFKHLHAVTDFDKWLFQGMTLKTVSLADRTETMHTTTYYTLVSFRYYTLEDLQ